MPYGDVAWSLDAERFNPNHAGAGAGGGQFTSAGPGGSGAKGSKGAAASQASPAHKEHLAHEAHLAHMAHLKAHPVAEGERGKRVSGLQDKLNELGAKPPLASDGIFGPKTLAAVKAFQRAHGLKPDGLVGPKTTAALEGAPAAPKAAPAHHHAPAHHAAKRAMMHEPLGKPGGPGLWGMKGAQLPAYIQHVRNDLMQSRGMDEPRATQMAIGIVRDWAAGRRGASAETQAKAVAAIAEFEKLRVQAKATANRSTMDDGDGAYKAAGASRGELFRCYPLEDVHILTRAEGDGSGRVVEAYATVFDQAAEIHDHQGHYTEVIDRTAFDATLARIAASPAGLRGSVKVLYNHGKTMEGVPAPEYQLPLGVPLEVRPEARGLLTRTEYDASDPFTDRILSKIRSGAITAQSFVGGIIRSAPELRGPGDRHRARNGALTTVRRMALGLREYGPVLFPAYTGAEILGVRMSIPGSLDDEPGYTEDEEYAPGMEGDVAGGAPEEVHPSRMNAHRLWHNRLDEACREAGIVLPGRG